MDNIINRCVNKDTYQQRIKDNRLPKDKKNETFESLWKYCISDNRVCPMPIKWNDLYKILNNTKQIGAGYEPPIPLILGAWGNTSNNEKQERLKIHIRWAEDCNQLDEVGQYLRSLEEKDWAHYSENQN